MSMSIQIVKLEVQNIEKKSKQKTDEKVKIKSLHASNQR